MRGSGNGRHTTISATCPPATGAMRVDAGKDLQGGRPVRPDTALVDRIIEDLKRKILTMPANSYTG
ncbi:hypothetical protein XH83_39390 (plasmid) [Bradyrhizobium sp. CCBAU 53351]|nr:hypothetical protein XH90_36250 [Bradyrhizobium sp. CCBAU 53338]QOZ64446.1 hypothetical protein XH86_37665 [Bradyrhizobium guangdongense]QOZ81445.1 hypothetical protein XH83_39390 [Bradyrhizobium sp. CCBAU 53351]